MQKRAYKYRFYPTDEQKKILAEMAEAWLMLAGKRAKKVVDGLESDPGTDRS